MLSDEVTSALDPMLVGRCSTALKMLAEEGMTMICYPRNDLCPRRVGSVAFFHSGIMARSLARSDFASPQNPETQKSCASVR
ncbi:hypothetical protein F2981_26580 (plasmid) [Sinorhizobium meliloti]|nr:hypothetical protein [Sinorhizobium meliloti]